MANPDLPPAAPASSDGPGSGARPPVYLIDGSGYIFRAYYAMRRLTTSNGQSTNAP